MMRKYVWIALGMLILSALACSFSVGDSGPPTINSVVVAKSLDKDFKAVEVTDTYAPDQTFYLSVEFSHLEKGANIKTEWYFEDQLVKDFTYTAETAGSGHAGFTLESGTGTTWPAGKYHAKVYLEDKLAQTVDFSVAAPESSAPAASTKTTAPTAMPAPTKTAAPTAMPAPTEAAGGEPAAGGEVVIASHNSYADHDGNLWVVGELLNNTGSNLSSLSVDIMLLDADKNALGTVTISPNTPVIPVDEFIPVGVFWPPDSAALESVDSYRIVVTDYQVTDSPVPPSPWSVEGEVNSAISDAGDISFSGTLTNQSNETLQQAEIWATIYDANDNILGGGMATMSFDNPLGPGESGSFKVTIAGPITDADHYDLVTVASGGS